MTPRQKHAKPTRRSHGPSPHPAVRVGGHPGHANTIPTAVDPGSLPFSSTGTARVFSQRNAVIDEIVPCLSKPNASAEESRTAATLVFGSMSPSGLVLAARREEWARILLTIWESKPPSPQRDTAVAQLEHRLSAVRQAKGRHDPR